MLSLLLGLFLLIGMPILMWVYESFVGFGYEWDGNNNPPFFIVACFWQLSLPVIGISKFADYLESIKIARIKREKERTKIRIAAEKEMEEYLEQIEIDLKKRRL